MGVDYVFLDYLKVFNTTAPHRKLIQKLEFQAGVRERLLIETESYLTRREHRTVFRGTFSSLAEVTSRVPQGSVFGPMPFLVHVNDLSEGTESYLNIFANDTKLMNEVQNTEWNI